MKLPPRTIDISGKRFGKLTVVGFAGSNKFNQTTWNCLCDCGGVKTTTKSALTSGATISCGCVSAQRLKEGREKHLMSKHPLYKTWDGMMQRCHNPNDKNYHYYGGRGIIVCDRWKDIHNFVADMGERPVGYSIDRIDVNGNYEPSNCRWASSKCQGGNKRNNSLIPVGDKLLILAEASRVTGVPETTISRKFKEGTWDSSSSERERNKLYTYNGKSLTIKEWSNLLGIKYGTMKYRIRVGLPIDKELR